MPPFCQFCPLSTNLQGLTLVGEGAELAKRGGRVGLEGEGGGGAPRGSVLTLSASGLALPATTTLQSLEKPTHDCLNDNSQYC